MTRARAAVIAIATACATAWPALARDGCPSSNVSDVMNDPAVRDAIADAWRDSHEGQPDEHEEGGWIYQCQMPNGDGTYRYYTQITRWPPGTIDESFPTTPHPDGYCRRVGDFHTHPGGAEGGDPYDNWRASDQDRLASAENGLPGIIAWGTGDHFELFDGSYPGIDEPRDPSWSCPTVPARPGSGWGEPHLMTLDGLTYDFQAIGDFSLVKAAAGDLEIQARQQPYRDAVHLAITAGLAIRDHDDRVEWAAGTFDPLIGGQARPMKANEALRLRSWGTLKKTNDGFVYLTAAGDRVTVYVGNEFLDYFIGLSRSRTGKVSGLLGNFDRDPDNDLASSTGRVIAVPPDEPADSGHPLYAAFGASWRVAAGGSLFATPFASKADVAAFPKRPTMPTSEAARAAAENKCAAQSLADEAAKRACVFDLSATGNETFLASAGRVDRSAKNVAATVEGTVSPDREITGRLDGADQRASFTIDLARGAYIFDERGSHDTSWTVKAPDGAQLLDANQSAFMGDNRARIVVAAPARHTITVSVRPPAARGQFRFRVRTVPAPVSKSISAGTDVSGRIATIGEEHVYRIALQKGTYDLRVQTNEDTSWALVGPDGKGLLDGNQQVFMENVPALAIPSAGTYTITVRGRGLVGLGNYRFSVAAR